MRRGLMFVLLFAVIAMAQQPVLAWNDLGHMLVAKIAFDQLNETEINSVLAILHHHPHIDEILRQDCPPNVTEGEWIFLRAATWPDQVRPPRNGSREPVSSHPIYRFHHGTWHYVNFEYRAGQRETSPPNQPLPHHPASSNPAERTDIIEQLDQSYMIVRGAARERSEPEKFLSPAEIRAVRLCWLFHLIGDIHQPLHVVALVDDRIPALQHGDEGGNKLGVRINHASAPRKLHAVWDDLLGTSAHYDHVVHLSEMFSRDPRLAPSKLQELSTHKQTCEFAEESYKAAKEIVYQNGRLHFALWSRIESHELAEQDVPVLSQQSIDQARTYAVKSVVLAGHRLAARLKYIVSRDAPRGIATGGVASPQRRERLEFQPIR